MKAVDKSVCICLRYRRLSPTALTPTVFFIDPKAECYANAGGGGIEKANEIALVHGLHYSGSF
jgi:hypothetical protein